MSAETKSGEATAERGYEGRDVRPGWLAFWIALLVAVVAATFLIARALSTTLANRHAAAQEPAHPMALHRRPPTAAVLQADPSAELAAYEAAQRELLSSYGWIDPTAGVVRLPIERAMELVAERGLPVRPQREGQER